jgi:hypothetical protein
VTGIDLVGMIVFMGSLTGIAAIVARAVVRYQDRRLRGRGEAPDPAVQAELEDMRAQLADHQDVRQRLVELEERMDFAERMLARAKPERLTPGGEGDR